MRGEIEAGLGQDWGEKWQHGGGRYALSDNSTVSRVEFYFYPSSTASGPPSPQGEGKKKGKQAVPLPPKGEGKERDGYRPSPKRQKTRKNDVNLGFS